MAWLLGDASRVRRLYTVALEERARRLEREREERAKRAVPRSGSGSPGSSTTSLPIM